MLGKDFLSVHSLKESEKILSETRANVISMIGVLEHLQHPRKAIESIIKMIILNIYTFRCRYLVCLYI